jgi:hypothetical protein
VKKHEGMDAIDYLSDVLFEDTGGPAPSMKNWPPSQSEVEVTTEASAMKQESPAFAFFDLISFAKK